MALKFSSGEFSDLKSVLSKVIQEDLWKEINKNTFQAKLDNGAVINYYSSTGTILIQGKDDAKKALEEIITTILTDTQNSSTIKKIQEFLKNDFVEGISKEELNQSKFLSDEFNDTEIVIGLVGAVGVEYKQVIEILKDRLKRNFNYDTEEIRISSDVIARLPIFDKGKDLTKEYDRISYLMEMGNNSRKIYDDNSILAMGSASIIKNKRKEGKRNAYIINSLKHPDEVKFLREIYSQGFYLIGVFSDINARHKFLTKELNIENSQAEELIKRDEDENDGYGQHTSDTFHLSDFFVYIDENRYKLKNGLHRFLDILFSCPTVTPTFEEYAMFMSFTSALRSADLSRQVGAVITKGEEIIASGANDCPKYGGGLYWPYLNHDEEIVDFELGRDYKRGEDSNVIEKQAIIKDIIHQLPENIDKETILKILTKSKIKDLTEYGRVVHAEMEALMMCSRNNISARHSVLYCTTFPCHNCAKHIIAAGVSRVIYIEPYPKSKALDFHSDSIKLGFKEDESDPFLYFEPFVGVGPRKFFDLFSMSIGSGRSIKRKNSEGKLLEWDASNAKLKIPLIPLNYIEREARAIEKFSYKVKK